MSFLPNNVMGIRMIYIVPIIYSICFGIIWIKVSVKLSSIKLWLGFFFFGVFVQGGFYIKGIDESEIFSLVMIFFMVIQWTAPLFMNSNNEDF